MVPGQQASMTEVARRPDGPLRSSQATRWVRWLEGLIFFFLILFAILLPHSIKGARYAWMAAGLLWLAKLAIERKRPFPQAPSAPPLAYIVLSGILTARSPPTPAGAGAGRVCVAGGGGGRGRGEPPARRGGGRLCVGFFFVGGGGRR